MAVCSILVVQYLARISESLPMERDSHNIKEQPLVAVSEDDECKNEQYFIDCMYFFMIFYHSRYCELYLANISGHISADKRHNILLLPAPLVLIVWINSA